MVVRRWTCESTVASQIVDPAAPGSDDPSDSGHDDAGPLGDGRGASGDWVVELSSALPGRCLALALPVVAVALVGFRVAAAGLTRTSEDPLSPVVLAAATVIGACVLGWRAWTQRARLDATGLHVRNLTVSFDLAWDQIERLQVERRLGLQVVEIRMLHLRRRHRLGAATRIEGPTADAVLIALGTHPDAGRLLDDSSGDPGDDVTDGRPGAP